MKLKTLFETIEYTVLQGACQDVQEIVYDSRKAAPGTLFVCLPGARADGHDYAHSAYGMGCRAFLCQRPVALPEDAFVAVTGDTRSALAEISAAFYDHPARKLKIIGITGTKGKTTTALLIRSVLEKNGIGCGYVGSNGVDIGREHYPTANTTPESLLMQGYLDRMVQAGLPYAVIEVSSQALEHNRVQGLAFEIGVFTNLSQDHIGPGEHGSFEEYKAAKRKLFTDYPCRAVVYNADDEASAYMTVGLSCPKISVSARGAATHVAENLSLYRDETTLGISFDHVCMGERTAVSVRSPGDFSVYNALTAMAACRLCGVSPGNAAEALACSTVTGRFQVVEGKPGCTFIIDYAHNGLSLRSALQVLRQYSPKRLICLFGSVGGRTKGRRRELAQVASQFADLCILTSDNPDFEEPEAIIQEILSHYDPATPYLVEPDREKAIALAVRLAQPGDIVLFAGKGHENYQLVEGKKLPFSEGQIILDTCAAISEEETICI